MSRFHLETYYIKRVTTSWEHSIKSSLHFYRVTKNNVAIVPTIATDLI